ncbi:RNAse E [Desulfonatronum thiosulfatophilum]|uniref:Ribonuclease G n=1 Tax=Desulfonatronum thiosulfatophilum TaxID=617002 RepID=A0A1G6DR58_9BACT|nr:Rne/Rng family ribonuclease [Desulfonatronum thiosulfatophilum]SDB47697.1 RNAse E [Desulfonatronum thiosulfatophilum]
MPTPKKRKKMFISVLPGEQVELILAEDAKITDYFIEMLHQAKTKGNIYKGTINNIDTALQAAFINYGEDRNGFLQIDEVHPEYYQTEHKPENGRKYPPLQKVLKPGQELLVQVVKEPTVNKGGFLTTYLSLAGRFLVLTPGQDQLGVSRKIEDDEERSRLKDILREQDLGEGIGLIARTNSEGQSKTNLLKDLQFLKRLWKDVRKKGMTEQAPVLIYQEKELAFRAVRDYLTTDVSEIWIDHPETAELVKEFVSLTFPRRQSMVKLHADTDRSLWERFNLEKQLEQLFGRDVALPSGGRLVFDQTEALMAVDVNSGKIGGTNFNEMVFKTNMEAAQEIGQQLRMRDVGGQIVIDFIEMRDPKHRREVEKELKAALKVDRARVDVGRLSKFGLLEMVRQRLGSSALSVSTEPCPHCKGWGLRRNMEWRALQALKDIYRKLRAKNCPDPLEYRTDAELALYLLNNKRIMIKDLEERFQNAILVYSEKCPGQ